MTTRERNRALVTGASSGIGRELARVHAARGGDLVLVARRSERLELLAAELRGLHGAQVRCVVADLAEEAGVAYVLDTLRRERIEVDSLLSAAGLGSRAAFAEADPGALDRIVRVNVLALTRLTRALLPAMQARGHGRILHVASMAAFVPGPLSATYHASKAYVLSLTEALAYEVKGTGVTVTAVCPGATATEFGEVSGMAHTRAFAHAVPAERVAERAYEAMLRGETVAVPALLDRVSSVLTRLLPRKLVTLATGLALRDVPGDRADAVR